MIPRCFIAVVYLLCQYAAVAQQRLAYSFQQYTVNRGLTSNAIHGMAEDRNGFIWLATNTSIQWFDGFTFRQVPFGNGPSQLPSQSRIEIHSLTDGRLLFCYASGFSVYDPASHRFRHYKTSAGTPSMPVLLAQNGNRIWLVHRQEVLLYDLETARTISHAYLPVILREKEHSYISSCSRGRYVVFTTASPYNIVLDTVSSQISTHVKQTPKLAPVAAVCMATDTSYVEISNKSIRYRHIATGITFDEVLLPSPLPTEPNGLVSYSQLNADTIVIAAGRSVVTFSLAQRQFLSQVVAVGNQPFLQAGQISDIMTDRYHNVWLASNVEGLFRINYSTNQFRFYGGGDKANFSICIAASKADNRVISGTYGQGIFIYDTSGLLLKHISMADPGYSHLVTVSSILRVGEHKYLFVLYGGESFYLLNTSNFSVQRTWIKWPGKPPKISFNYYNKLQPADDKTFTYSTSDDRVMLLSVEGNMVRCHELIESPVAIMYARNNWLAGATSDKKILVQKGNYREIYEPFRQTVAINGITQTRDSIFWVASSSGLYQLGQDGKIDKQYTTTEGLANDYIFSIVADNDENIWASHFKGISKINGDGRITNISAAEGLQGDEFNTGSVFKTPDGEIYFGGVNGVNSFYPEQISRISELPDIITTRISAGDLFSGFDTAFWSIKSITLKSPKNALQISVSALGKQVAEIYNYQYRLRSGASGEWTDLKHGNSMTLSLDYGEYELDLYAGSYFDPLALPIKTIRIIINPPFYRTWWFFTGCSVVVILLLWQLLRWLNKKKYNRRLKQALQVQQQLENERERISRDLHDNMGAYTSALLANVQQFRETHADEALLKKMESNAGQILSSLRETIWVLNHQSVTIRDFSDGFKNYCFKILRNFEDIRFNAEEAISVNKEIPASKAVHLNKLLQEAIQNIIKHADATVITYSLHSESNIIISITDNGRGFDFRGLEKGNGIDNMQWRAAEAGYRLFIEPVKGSGTQIRIEEIVS